MTVEKINTLVVGAGQAGVAMSEHLSKNNVGHVVLEKNRIAENWRTGRWDSLVANGPAWHDRFPGMEFSDLDADTFAPKERVADYFVAYAKKIEAPIRCGVEVLEANRNVGRPGFSVKTSEGDFEVQNIVAATGAFQKPIIPQLVPKETNVMQMHSFEYRNPSQLPDGAVMVVGAGASGAQIADELIGTGKRVYMSVGPHDRPPRSYRGRDNCWWLGVLGKWELVAQKPGTEHVTIAVSGAHGGHTVDFRRLASKGATLLGRTESYQDGVFSFTPDLIDNIAYGDRNYLSVLDEADAYVERNGLDFPEEPEARIFDPDPESMINPIRELSLEEESITSIIWATGFSRDYSWLKVDALDEQGNPNHQRGVSSEIGVYFLGLPWQSRRGSTFIWGVWHDAKHIADYIATQANYLAYRGPEQD